MLVRISLHNLRALFSKKLRGLEEFVINCSGMTLSCRALSSYTVDIISAAEFRAGDAASIQCLWTPLLNGGSTAQQSTFSQAASGSVKRQPCFAI